MNSFLRLGLILACIFFGFFAFRLNSDIKRFVSDRAEIINFIDEWRIKSASKEALKKRQILFFVETIDSIPADSRQRVGEMFNQRGLQNLTTSRPILLVAVQDQKRVYAKSIQENEGRASEIEGWINNKIDSKGISGAIILQINDGANYYIGASVFKVCGKLLLVLLVIVFAYWIIDWREHYQLSPMFRIFNRIWNLDVILTSLAIIIKILSQ